ncbi:hypothetical protein AO377_0714 [Moraxella catarrhalis]|nr:hypothetical protein AO377_0714 [Moraxella catarrhalis]OAV16711.1 hypothetical protein AO375_0396 [Moraxella catarrhalis]OAV36701.1 hypothetical protein AO365_0662 [Moraxella catarrhalis]
MKISMIGIHFERFGLILPIIFKKLKISLVNCSIIFHNKKV